MSNYWNPYAYGTPPGPVSSGQADADRRDERWWVVPAVCTPLVVLLAFIDFRSAGPSIPAVWAIGYVVPAALVVASWLQGRTVRRRTARSVLAAMGCALAFFHTETIMAVLLAVWFGDIFVKVVQATVEGL
ncbi:hypothetical protein [Streptomyces sp. NPDC004726]